MEHQKVEITDVNAVAAIITKWHSNCKAQVAQLIEFPEDQPITIVDNLSGNEVVLTGEARSAFIEGLKVGLDIFKVLPFHAEVTETSV